MTKFNYNTTLMSCEVSAHSSNDMAGHKSFHNKGNLLFLRLCANISSGHSAKKLSFNWINDTKHPNNWKILTSIGTINTIHDIPAQLLPCLSSRRCMNRAGNIPALITQLLSPVWELGSVSHIGKARSLFMLSHTAVKGKLGTSTR